MIVSGLDAPPEDLGGPELGGRGGALRSVADSVAAVRSHMTARMGTMHRSSVAPPVRSVAGTAGAADLLLAPVGEGEDALRRTLRTLGLARQRSLADYLG